jgi:sigma-B regulation protein RsbU (phosphoserine phosphatase)
MEEELALAADIQAQLFPQVLPGPAGWELAARNRPARQCGGDYYDVLSISRQGEQPSYLFCMADVSGKGLPAALLMSNLQAILRSSLAWSPSLIELAARTNALLLASTPPDKYVTAILALVDPATGNCSYVNAGHNGGILLKADGTAEVLESTGAPLGLIAGIPYASGTLALNPGDTLVLYSDGVPEAFDLNEEEWGTERLIDSLRECRELGAADTIAAVFGRLDAHVGAAPPHDDVTLLVVSRRR